MSHPLRNRVRVQAVAFCVLFGVAVAPMARAAGDLAITADFASAEIAVNGQPLTQSGDANAAMILQNGQINIASIDQVAASGGRGNYAEIDQTGLSNIAHSTQEGEANRLRIFQDGTHNLATAARDDSGVTMPMQSGLRNTLDIAQTGDGNILTVSQIGNDNSIVATQPGGATANLVELGNNDVIVSHQGPATLYVNVKIVGDGMTVTVNPN